MILFVFCHLYVSITMDSRDCRKKRAKQNLKKCESSDVSELDSSDDENKQDDISKFNFHFSTILGDI